jgi:hypothetical protein
MQGVPTVKQIDDDLGKFLRDTKMPAMFAGLLLDLKRVVAACHAIPIKKSHLSSLIMHTNEVLSGIQRLQRICPVSSQANSALQGFLASVARVLEFLRGLAEFNTPLGQARVRRALEQRFTKSASGALLVGYCTCNLTEKLDPLHRNLITPRFQIWLNQHIQEGTDPAREIVDFLLSLHESKNYQLAGIYLSADDTSASEVKLVDGYLYAYYAVDAAGKERRIGQRELTDPTRDFLSVRRKLYKSRGTTDLRGADFKRGETYVLSARDKLYTWGFATIHSSLLAGGSVKSAGLLVSVDGKVHAIDNRSGHYRPNCHNLFQAVSLLERKGVFDSEAIVGLVVEMSYTMFFTVNDYLALGKTGFRPEEVRKVVLNYRVQHGGKIPVPGSKLEFIPDGQKGSWSEKDYDLFLQHFSNRLDSGLVDNTVVIGGHRAAKAVATLA